MTVVLIIGILVSIAIPVYQTSSATAQAKACMANQRTITGAIDMYRDSNGAGAVTAGQFAAGGSGWYALLIPDWVKSKPTCPAGQTNYLVDASGNIIGDNGATSGIKAGHSIP